MNKNISIFSKGLYSSWCYHDEYRILFDCGEGCATHLSNKLTEIEHVFIGHTHGDHVLGLPSLIGCRNNARGTSRNEKTFDHNKPLNIYYPKDNKFDNLLDFIEKQYGHWLRYRLNFVPITAGHEVALSNITFVRAFEMKHQKNATTLGYVIYEKRARLRPDLKHLLPKEIGALAKSGVKVNEPYRYNKFAYCLDAFDIPDKHELDGCEEVVMDCTFIDESDRDDDTHFTLHDARTLCNSVGVKKMYAGHFSSRYDFQKTSTRHPNVDFINPNIVNII